jgi:hypothetical protein
MGRVRFMASRAGATRSVGVVGALGAIVAAAFMAGYSARLFALPDAAPADAQHPSPPPGGDAGEIATLRARVQALERELRARSVATDDLTRIADLLATSAGSPADQEMEPAGDARGGAGAAIFAEGSAWDDVARVGAALRDLDPAQPHALRVRAARALLGTSRDDMALYALGTLLELDLDAGLGALDRVIDATRQSPNLAHTAVRAVSLLESVESPQADAALLTLARDDRYVVRLQAAQLLDDRGYHAPLDRLEEQLTTQLRSDQQDARLAAVLQLGYMGRPSSLSALDEMLRDESTAVRSRAVWAVGRLESPQAAAALRSALSDPDPEVRERAEQMLDRLAASGVGGRQRADTTARAD